MNQVYTNMLFLEHLFTFFRLESHVVDPPQPIAIPIPLKDGIRFERVTFRYPGNERPALEDFSCFIPAGKTVAFVGTNGAGKSTLIKLLCRFYDPGSGTVSLDNIDVRCVSQSALRQQLTILLQQPLQFHATAAENIAYGDCDASPDATAIQVAAYEASADVPIARLPHGYETMLGKQFGGADFSGGEWQRIALARAVLRQAPIMILDEPTSAMDSWAETAWLERFRRLAVGRTVLIITHRFTTAKQADLIYVMDQGQIVESGGHHELLAQGGRYAESWTRQMQTHTEETFASRENIFQ